MQFYSDFFSIFETFTLNFRNSTKFKFLLLNFSHSLGDSHRLSTEFMVNTQERHLLLNLIESSQILHHVIHCAQTSNLSSRMTILRTSPSALKTLQPFMD